MACDVVCVGGWNADFIVHVPRPIARGETLQGSSFEILPGGKGSNAAVACSRQGARVAMIARIGDDDFGRMALALWKREGIDTKCVEVAGGEASGVAQILVYDDGDNSIAVAPGANAGLGAAQVMHAEGLIRTCKVVMSSCEAPLEATQAAFEIARKAGAMRVFNPAPATPLPDSLISLCDLLVPNETELQSLARTGARTILVTLGARGCVLYRAGERDFKIPGYSVKVADTIGAGDTFFGALAAALARGERIETAMAWANAAAALSVTGRGAIGGMPLRDAVAALLGR
jgi:ribokinase